MVLTGFPKSGFTVPAFSCVFWSYESTRCWLNTLNSSARNVSLRAPANGSEYDT